MYSKIISDFIRFFVGNLKFKTFQNIWKYSKGMLYFVKIFLLGQLKYRTHENILIHFRFYRGIGFLFNRKYRNSLQKLLKRFDLIFSHINHSIIPRQNNPNHNQYLYYYLIYPFAFHLSIANTHWPKFQRHLINGHNYTI